MQFTEQQRLAATLRPNAIELRVQRAQGDHSDERLDHLDSVPHHQRAATRA